MKLYLSKLLILLTYGMVFGQSKLIHKNLKDDINISIYIPDGYNKWEAYDIVYFNDGENLLDAFLSDKLDNIIREGTIPPIIAVAISHPFKRTDRYLPYNDTWVTKSYGTYNKNNIYKYTNDIVQKVIPFIKSNYKVKKQALIGFSFGGLHAVWVGIHYPELFDFVGGMSPSLWVGNNAIFEEKLPPNLPAFWIDIGTIEWNYYVPMYEKLRNNGLREGKEVFYYEVLGGKHSIQDWINRLEYPLKVLTATNLEDPPKMLKVFSVVIPSKSQPGKNFRRINAVLTLANGVPITLASDASYRIIDAKNQGEFVRTDGSYDLGELKNMMLEVSYQNFSDKIKVY